MLRGALEQKLTGGVEGKIDAREKIFTIIFTVAASHLAAGGNVLTQNDFLGSDP